MIKKLFYPKEDYLVSIDMFVQKYSKEYYVDVNFYPDGRVSVFIGTKKENVDAK